LSAAAADVVWSLLGVLVVVVVSLVRVGFHNRERIAHLEGQLEGERDDGGQD
jgi:hypothetical protein